MVTLILTVQGDVREAIDCVPAEPVTLIANFAAVHQEPGHKDYEYYQANLLGADSFVSGLKKLTADK